jgi:hypothetical protein
VANLLLRLELLHVVRRHTTMCTARDLQKDGAREQERLARAMRALRRQHCYKGGREQLFFLLLCAKVTHKTTRASHGPKLRDLKNDFILFYIRLYTIHYFIFFIFHDPSRDLFFYIFYLVFS